MTNYGANQAHRQITDTSPVSFPDRQVTHCQRSQLKLFSNEFVGQRHLLTRAFPGRQGDGESPMSRLEVRCTH
jgi:hypothetical protein